MLEYKYTRKGDRVAIRIRGVRQMSKEKTDAGTETETTVELSESESDSGDDGSEKAVELSESESNSGLPVAAITAIIAGAVLLLISIVVTVIKKKSPADRHKD